MKKSVIVFRASVLLMMLMSQGAYAAGCEYDSQCKGDRICEDGRCVYDDSDSNSGDDDDDRGTSNRGSWWCCNPATGGTPACSITRGASQAYEGGVCSCDGLVGTGYACRR